MDQWLIRQTEHPNLTAKDFETNEAKTCLAPVILGIYSMAAIMMMSSLSFQHSFM